MTDVERYNDAHPEREWGRLDRDRVEFAVTLRALDEYLPPAPARVLDIGGGPGRYAIELSRRGYDVTLSDVAEVELSLATEKASEQACGSLRS
jgi:2-polyprenyl-3-methyl-5-hydroxy-6-metoxy-1,4-benzoquinol methylase